jgi:hypothetical protein
VQPPYTLDCVRAPPGKELSVAQVKKVLERHFQKKAAATPRKGG